MKRLDNGLEIIELQGSKQTGFQWAKRMLISSSPRSPEAFLDDILALPGFNHWKDDLAKLQEHVMSWRQQGMAFDKMCSSMHVLIVLEDLDTALTFAKHYHGFLDASNFFSEQARLGVFDAAKVCGVHKKLKDCSINFKHGTLLIYNISKLCGLARSCLSSMLHGVHNVVLIVVCERDRDLKYLNAKQSQFSLVLDRLGTLSGISTETILKLIELRLNEDYNGKMQIEGGFDGPYARALAQKALRTQDIGNQPIEAIVRDSIRTVLARQNHRNLIQSKMPKAKPDLFWISKSDIMGPEPDLTTVSSAAWIELQRMVGLEDVKTSIEAFINGRLVDYHRELGGRPPLRTGLSRLFIGPPGTGKF